MAASVDGRTFETPEELMKYIEHLGVYEAIQSLMPTIRHAGAAACLVQRGIKAGQGAGLRKDLGNPFSDALTDGDLLVEDMIGGAVVALFKDVSFYGEEHASDHISKYIPAGRQWLVTLDPINGTRFFENGLPCFETIVTLCCQDSIRGAIVHFPWSEKTIFAADGKAFHIPSATSGAERLALPVDKARQTILLGNRYADRRKTLEAMGYAVSIPLLDYHDTGPWDICPSGILDGRICGFALSHEQQLIDNVAIAHVAKAAGAVVTIEGLDFETKLADRLIAATNDKVYHDIVHAIS